MFAVRRRTWTDEYRTVYSQAASAIFIKQTLVSHLHKANLGKVSTESSVPDDPVRLINFYSHWVNSDIQLFSLI